MVLPFTLMLRQHVFMKSSASSFVTTPVGFWRCLGLILSASGNAAWPSEIPIRGTITPMVVVAIGFAESLSRRRWRGAWWTPASK